MGPTPISYYNGYATTGDTMARRFGVFSNGAPMPIYSNDTYNSNGQITNIGQGFRANRIITGIKQAFAVFGAIGSVLGSASSAFAWTNPYVAAFAAAAPLVGKAGVVLGDTVMSVTGLTIYNTPEPMPSWQSRYSPFPSR